SKRVCRCDTGKEGRAWARPSDYAYMPLQEHLRLFLSRPICLAWFADIGLIGRLEGSDNFGLIALGSNAIGHNNHRTTMPTRQMIAIENITDRRGCAVVQQTMPPLAHDKFRQNDHRRQ